MALKRQRADGAGGTIVWVAAALVGVQLAATDLMAPAMPLLLQENAGLTPQALVSSYLAGFAIAHLFIAPLGDRWGRKSLIFAGLALYAGSAFVAATLAPADMVVACRFVQGLGGASAPILARALIRDQLSAEEGVRALSQVGLIVALVALGAPLIGGLLADLYGWRATLLAMSVFALFAALLTYCFAVDMRPMRSEHAVALPFGLPRHREFWLISAIAAVGYAGLPLVASVCAETFRREFGVSVIHFGFWWALLVSGYALGSYASMRLPASWGVRRRLLMGAALMLLGGALLACASIAGGHAAITAAPIALYMFAWGVMQPAAQAAVVADYPHAAGRVSAMYGFLQTALGAALSMTFGGAALQSVLAFGLSLALFGLASTVLAYCLRPARAHVV